MIRPTTREDSPALLGLTEHTGMFKPLEVEALREVLDDYHATNREELDHVAVTWEQDGAPVAFAYWAPTPMTDRTWHLYWIVVRAGLQGGGVGGKLLKYAEEDIALRKGRILLIETSSLPHYERTRAFYLKHGYEQHAVLRDYYADGDDMVVFRKRLT
jgi:GNAT superfamily N-acetyltransferase